MRDLFDIRRDDLRNLEAQPEICADQLAPVVRMGADMLREGTRMRWGVPAVKPRARVLLNARNVGSPYWRPWLKPEWRCLVPATSFCEPHEANGGEARWFARNADRTPFAFAGLWRLWAGERGPQSSPIVGIHFLYSFLTIDPKAAGAQFKGMPVILRTPAEWDLWLRAPAEDVIALQRAVPSEALVIVSGEQAVPPAAS